MDRTEKAATIATLKGRFEKMTSAVLVSFQGMTVADVTKLRDEFRKTGVHYAVVKNTLVKQAVKDIAWGKLLDKPLRGMTGIAWSFEDPSAAAKVVKAFRKDNEKLKVKAGIIEGTLLDAAGVEERLASMPGKQELRAQLLATMQAPMQNFVQLLNAPAQNFAYLLAAKKDKG